MIKKTDNLMKFVNNNADDMDRALSRMSKDILQISKVRVPFKRGNLQKQGESKKIAKMKHRVVYDEEYAAYQERGQRKDGTRRVINYSTPGTGKDFLKGAGQTVGKQALNYLRQAANRKKL